MIKSLQTFLDNQFQSSGLNSFISAQFFRFVVVGTIGFLVDAVLLLFLDSLGGGAFLSRAVSFPAAILSTWLLNRSWTFAGKQSDNQRTELLRYATVNSIAAIANLVVYAAAILTFPILRDYLIIALGFGAATGLFVNYSGMRLYVFVSGNAKSPPTADQ